MTTRVLILDDEESYRQILGRLLERRGYEVETVARSDDAVEVARSFRPDLLVADWMLGGSEVGPQIAARLRGDLPELKTILITGYPESQLEGELQQAPVDRVLEKPFPLEDFIEVVAAVLAEP